MNMERCTSCKGSGMYSPTGAGVGDCDICNGKGWDWKRDSKGRFCR